MSIVHFISHRVQRGSPTAPTTSQQRQSEITIDGKISESAKEAKLGMMKRLGKVHGRFSSDTGAHPMSCWLAEYLDEKMSFTTFSQKVIQNFALEIDKTESVVDAFVFCVHERLENGDEVHMYLIDHCHGVYLDGELEMTDALYLDIHNPKLAARICIQDWQADDSQSNYLSLLTWRGEKELSDAFTETIGFTDKADIKAETEAFLESVDSYTHELPEAVAVETREKVVDYCLEQEKSGNAVIMADLSQHLNPNKADDFISFVQAKKPDIKPELIPDKTQLKQYVRISGRDDMVSMSFDSKYLGNGIDYNTDTDTLVINKIPAALKSRLLKHLRNKG